MKKIFLALLLCLGLMGVAVRAQAAHSNTLAWTASADSTATAPGTATVYRANGDCAVATGFVAFASGLAPGGVYVDTTVVGGDKKCYYVTAVINSIESPPSNKVVGQTPLAVTGAVSIVSK